MEQLFIGLMSGTSLDGVDGVLAAFGAADAPVRILSHCHQPFTDEFASRLLALNSSGPDELHCAALAANNLARVYSSCVQDLLRNAGLQSDQLMAIGAHGQTVRHRPGEFDGIGYTLQLNAPALLAELTGVDVIADFRSRDVAAGGQGAPLVPAFHRAAFGRDNEIVAVLNLGGISNLTVLDPGESTAGFDCGPANVLMDHWCRLHIGTPFDEGGSWAASGKLNPDLLANMLAEPYFARVPPKSTGRDLFNPQWLAGHLNRFNTLAPLRPEDVQTTLAEVTVQSCASAVLRYAGDAVDLLVCGGGALNKHLLVRLSTCLPGMRVNTTQSRGLPPMLVEACAFAWLARAWTRGEAGNLSQVTGASGSRVLGALYPGR